MVLPEYDILLDARGGGRCPVYTLRRNCTRKLTWGAYFDYSLCQFVNLSICSIFYQGNILLNSACHCQITDIGTTRNFDATTSLMSNFAAPELLGMCSKCCRFECSGCDWNQEGRETMQMDVHAFGCLHYAVRRPPACLIQPA